MCGITGIIQFEQPILHDGWIDEMTKTIEHRGPDAMQIKKYQHAHLGHQRLAMIDVTYGQQPMTKHEGDKHYTIVYNGELYNTKQLREKLQQKGYQFTTYSDTEVLLVCYMHYGPEQCLQQLVSDVLLCTLLSGGIDSSILTAMAARSPQNKGRTLKTY